MVQDVYYPERNLGSLTTFVCFESLKDTLNLRNGGEQDLGVGLNVLCQYPFVGFKGLADLTDLKTNVK